ncbi:hypothetical protein BDV59DRAFT_186648 [Aspergillus ambiguus]|uniref:uncharacterized protein n=1 Tax=Aspergillus ambiguus TaxID=176160 RepID=UPI003CCE1013
MDRCIEAYTEATYPEKKKEVASSRICRSKIQVVRSISKPCLVPFRLLLLHAIPCTDVPDFDLLCGNFGENVLLCLGGRSTGMSNREVGEAKPLFQHPQWRQLEEDSLGLDATGV